jgi:hypothetical protein
VILTILWRQAAPQVIAWIDDRAAVVAVGGVVGDQHREEAAGEVRPSDPVLVEPISLYARRLEDELVFEEARRLAVDLLEHAEQSRIERESKGDRPDIADRIERFERAIAGEDIRPPASTEVENVLEMVVFRQEPFGFDRCLFDLGRGVEPPDDDKAVGSVRLAERADG